MILDAILAELHQLILAREITLVVSTKYRFEGKIGIKVTPTSEPDNPLVALIKYRGQQAKQRVDPSAYEAGGMLGLDEATITLFVRACDNHSSPEAQEMHEQILRALGWQDKEQVFAPPPV